MHFVIVGCGAVGGYFGGRLVQHGEKVTFVARGESLNKIRTSGLTINSIEGDVHLANVDTLDAKKITNNSLTIPADVIFLCVKSYQLPEAIVQIKPLIQSKTRVIALLNGVNAVDIMQKHGIALENIIGGVAKIIAEKVENGVIHHTGGKPHITLGAYTDKQPTHDIAKHLKLSGISVGVTSDITLALWRKFIFVAAWGALASAKKLNLGEIRSQSHIEFLLERIIHEYADIAREMGVNITDKHIKETLTFLSRLPDASETSMQRDIVAGKPSEFDILVAYPMSQVTLHNLSAPVLTQCYQTLVANT